MRFGITKKNRAPETEIDIFRKNISTLFDDFFDPVPTGFFDSDWIPAVDIEENDNGISVKAEIPGMNEKDIRVTIEKNMLTISGEKKEEREEKKNRRVVSERRYGTFSRSFQLPAGIKRDEIKADFKNGILTISMPKAESEKNKKIEISVN